MSLLYARNEGGNGPRPALLSGWDLAEWLRHLTVNAVVATVLSSIPASSDTVESEGRQMEQCWIQYIKNQKTSSTVSDYRLSIYRAQARAGSARCAPARRAPRARCTPARSWRRSGSRSDAARPWSSQRSRSCRRSTHASSSTWPTPSRWRTLSAWVSSAKLFR